MTLQEYMNPGRFALTTQRGLSPKNQLLLDAFNYDQMREYLEDGGTVDDLDEEATARWAELQAKIAEQPRLLRELREAEEADGGPG